MDDVVLVLTTIGESDAAAFASALIDERLAACVNIHGPMRSTYRWKGTVEVETEQQLVIKTVRGQLPALEKRLHELHPYELPEFIVVAADQVSDGYARWVGDETQR